jgi:hypothetical protein
VVVVVVGGGVGAGWRWWWCLQWFAMNLDIYVVVGHPTVRFLQVLETSPCKGGSAEIFN